jgi:light-regulated signal transduction histidine kinase (bacteriophytochrome)
LSGADDSAAKTIERLRRQLARERKARAEAESIAERATRRLYDANVELQRANRDLAQFAYVASHDLQEPLRMVSKFTELLIRRYKGRLDADADADADEFLAFAVDGAKRMQGMIADLLEYSRVGQHGADEETADANAALLRALSNLRVSIEESGGVVTHDPLPTVAGGGAELARVFQNLVGNALKFRGEDAPRIHVTAAREGNFWRFSVRDNGIGIRPEDHEKVFALFRRLQPRERYPGTGMGLSISKRIVEHLGGRIGVESEPGRGSTFHFTLPAAPGSES